MAPPLGRGGRPYPGPCVGIGHFREAATPVDLFKKLKVPRVEPSDQQ